MVTATVSAPVISVVLVDDHELVRRGTKELLKRDQAVKVVGEAASTRDAVTVICERQPDIAIVDIRLHDGSGLDVIRECQRLGVSTRFMILSAYADDHYVRPLVRMGVRGYLVKTSGGAELKKAIHDVADGKLVFPGEVADTVLAVLRSGYTGQENGAPAPNPFVRDSLTGREQEVLDRMGDGLSNREIGTVLGISIKTVEAHLRKVFFKMGVNSRTQAVTTVLRGHFAH